MRLIKLLVVLIVAAVIALVGYAYLGDMQPSQREVRDPIPVQDGALAPAEAAAGSGPESGTESAPAEAAPSEEARAEEAPAEEAPADAAPAEEAPAEEQPAPITGEDTTEAPGD